jgi:D-aminopeptidase
MRPRARERGFPTGRFRTGPANAITDVHGVTVGHCTVFEGDPGDPVVARTGITVIDCAEDRTWERRFYAGSHVLHGLGQLTGRDMMEAQGFLSGPIFLTGTRSVGAVYEAAIQEALVDAYGEVPIPTVGECDDGYLSSAQAVVTREHVHNALLNRKGGPVEEGCVGAGTGMHLFAYKGGIGTASRVVENGIGLSPHTVGVLVLTNFGSDEDLRLPASVSPADPPEAKPHPGSCIGLLVTDAPLHPQQLSRFAMRIGFGLVRTGSVGRPGSGEIFLAVSTAHAMDAKEALVAGPFLQDNAEEDANVISDLYAATVDAAEEAVWNALCAATTVVGQKGRVVRSFFP